MNAYAFRYQPLFIPWPSVSSFEERAKCVENIVEKHKERSTFEEFAAHVFAPVLPPQSTFTTCLVRAWLCWLAYVDLQLCLNAFPL